MINTVVVVPTYNERENLSTLVEQVLSRNVDLIIVDDSSPDGTGAIADQLTLQHPGLTVIHRAARGYAGAVLEGIKLALKRHYPLILQMDADLSHDPAAIPQLIEASAHADMVIGSRYTGGIRVKDWEVSRILLSWTANHYARFLTRIPVRDVTSGFRCYRRSTLERLDLDHFRSNGYAFAVELAFWVWNSGGRIKEVPITFFGRQRGRSKMSKLMILEAAILPWRLLARQGRAEIVKAEKASP